MPDKSLTSKQAAELLCEKGRTDFLTYATGYGVLAGSLGILFYFLFFRNVTPLTTCFNTVFYSYSILTGYLLLGVIASVIMHFRKDGKYWDIYTFQSSWYNGINPFQRKLVVVEDIGEIRDFSGKWIFINGARISDLFCESKKEFSSEDGVGYGVSYRCTWRGEIHLNGKTCTGTFKNFDEKPDISFKQDQYFLVIGKVSGIMIEKLKTAPAIKSDVTYTQSEFRNTKWFQFTRS